MGKNGMVHQKGVAQQFAWAFQARKVRRADYLYELGRLTHLSAASQTRNLAVVSTGQRALTRKNMLTQMECLPKNV